MILCAGKVYYELLEARRSRGLANVAIIRVEQLYPFPKEEFNQVIQRYPNVEEYIWCQEEPQNQGAWDQINPGNISCTSDDPPPPPRQWGTGRSTCNSRRP
jgi:2-oxoglutarate dehydrogenase complex dehydrogenase (E1) component-like enzyme